MNIKRIILVITLSIAAILSLGYMVKNTPILKGFKTFGKALKLTKNGGSTYDTMKRHYDNRCSSLLDKIKDTFQVPENYWKAFLDKLDELRAKDPLFIENNIKPEKQVWQQADHPLVKKAVALLREHGLNPEAVSIVVNNYDASPAAALQTYITEPESVKTTLLLNITKLGARAPDIQEAIIRHEIMHLIHYDSIEEGYVLSILEEVGHRQNEWDTSDVMIAYRQLKEFRADQLAAAQGGLHIAQAFKDDLSTIAYHDETISHPASSKRAAQMTVVENYLKKEQPSSVSLA